MSDPSKPLDPKRETFLEGLLAGCSAAESYRKAYPRASQRTSEVEGSLMRNEPDVGLRLEWMQRRIAEKVVEKFTWSKVDALLWLKGVVDTPIGEVDRMHPLCQEYTCTTTDSGGSERFKMPAQLDAVKTIGSWLKWETGTEADNIQADSLGEFMRTVASRK